MKIPVERGKDFLISIELFLIVPETRCDRHYHHALRRHFYYFFFLVVENKIFTGEKKRSFGNKKGCFFEKVLKPFLFFTLRTKRREKKWRVENGKFTSVT